MTASEPLRPSPSRAPRVDPRGLRFVAAVTAAVLVTVLLTSNAWLLVAQTAVFAVAVLLGVHRSPYALLFQHLVRPRLGAPTELEDARPPRFAALVGLVFTALGSAALLAGAQVIGLVATGAALVAALLNAVFGLCLGCELYLVAIRITHRLLPRRAGDGAATPATATEVSA